MAESPPRRAASMRRLNPDSLHPPFANYAHGVEVPPALG